MTVFKVNDTVRVTAARAKGKEGIVRIVEQKPIGRPPKTRSGILVAFDAAGTSDWYAADELVLVSRPGG